MTGLVGCEQGEAEGRGPSIDSVVGVAVRPAALDSGRAVLQVKNNSGQQLSAVRLSLSDKDTRQQFSATLAIGAGQTREVGWREGWSVGTNDLILLSADGYDGGGFETFRTADGGIGLRPSEILADFRRLKKEVDDGNYRARLWQFWRWFLWTIVGAAAVVMAIGAWRKARAESRRG
ncbi:MAG TPA: hypothetical protein VEA69_14810 [Tepidisphaeraceae bacterium]|nr:hypothetical protein [Tepidisphaeraceae bacterium]